MLADAGQADVAMAPSADMFEMGVKVQVLKRGSMFPQRAVKLHELYSQYRTLEELPLDQKQMLERTLFKKSLDAEWEQTRLFFQERDPAQLSKAASDPRHKMPCLPILSGTILALGKTGKQDRILDYQIWCGPAIGAFNEWVRVLLGTRGKTAGSNGFPGPAGGGCLMRCNWITAQGVSFHPEMDGSSRCPFRSYTT
jgi:PfaD family protein